MEQADICERLKKHKDDIQRTAEVLNDVNSLVCFLRIVSCNADEPCCFTDAWCTTERSIDASELKKPVVCYADLFNVAILLTFIDSGVPRGSDVKHSKALLLAFDRLSQFLDNLGETSQIVLKFIKKDISEAEWTGVFSTHIVKKLAVFQDLRISDVGTKKNTVCICGCGEDLVYGDTSMGNLQVWHGSVDILVGCVAIDVAKLEIEELGTSASEMKKDNLEKYRHQLVAETIVFSFTQNKGLVPTIAVSKDKIKVFLYDPDSDLLFETVNFPLVSLLCQDKLAFHTIVALWLAINYPLFCLGSSPTYKDTGYLSNFKSFIGTKNREIYEKQVHLFGCKKVQTLMPDLENAVVGRGISSFWRVPRS